MNGAERRREMVPVAAVAIVLLIGLLRMVGTSPGSALEAHGSGRESTTGRDRREAQAKQKDTGMSVVAPSIGLDAPVVELGIGEDEQLDVPRRFDQAGWWSDGVQPGSPGPAVIAGHVDSTDGPAVFEQLHELAPGDEILVRREDGPSVRFVVTRSAQVEKSRFPTAEVYGQVPDPELRLITCIGQFDRAAGHYTDNLIVFASLSR